jgi:RNA polymerase sigma-54 factor
LLLQPRLNLKVSQRQVLTPGLVQMVSVLALNKLELKEMINSEMVENPVLEELEESAATIDELAGIEGDRERSVAEVAAEAERVEKDPFDEIDFGSYFQDYLDPGFKTASNFEESDKPSFEHFLAQPSTLSDHLLWQVGALTLTARLRAAVELVIGNLDENGYLTASDDELAEALAETMRAAERDTLRAQPIPFDVAARALALSGSSSSSFAGVLDTVAASNGHGGNGHIPAPRAGLAAELAVVAEARRLVIQLDPVGVGARDLRECLLAQITAQRREAVLVAKRRNAWAESQALQAAEFEDADEGESEEESGSQVAEVSFGAGREDVFDAATHIVAKCLPLLQKKDMRELTRSCGRTAEQVQAAVEFIRTLDPRPGQRYNLSETRLIEPDVAFVKRDDRYVVLMNEEDMPTLRLNQGYRRMLREKQTDKSAIQLLRNIEQRKNTIVRTCEVIVRRQQEFLEHGEQSLKPMMIKEVAEEIGVHPSTVSRAVANKYVHTSQGVYELRFFFSEGVNGPEGGDLPLVLLKRKVKKLIEEENPRKPLTDDQLAIELKAQGINVTRRTVAKYREDMQIPSTHQRRVR